MESWFYQNAQYNNKNALCLLLISEQTSAFILHIINRLAFITEVESIYCALHTESSHKRDYI